MKERINAIANSLVESIAYKPNEYDLGIAKDALTMIATEQRKIDKEEVGRICSGWYNYYLRKCQSPSEYSRTIAPAQMDAVDRLKTDLLNALKG